MKKILSIMTAVSLAMTAMLSAVTVTAAEKITADEVRDMIYSTGLKAYPELWDKTIINFDEEQDVLRQPKEKLKDITDIYKTYSLFNIKKEDGKYIIQNNHNDVYLFFGYSNENKSILIGRGQPSGELTYSLRGDPANEDDSYARIENYEWISEVINNSNIDNVQEIKVAEYICEYAWYSFFIYVKDKSGNEYAIYTEEYTDEHAENLGKEIKSIKCGEVMSLNEFCSTAEVIDKNFAEDQPKFEEINGDEIRDTDTRAAYIGTESKFSDVSGDLVSYVNELNDLGIINGYDENLFKPENTITRAEAAAMLTRILRYSGKYSGEFKDVSADDWFADDVSALVAEGLINGYNDTTFAPYEKIKYQEVMKILVYALGYATFEMAKFPESYPSETNSKAMQIGLTNNLKSFDTTAPITRGDMAIMLSNALDTHLFTSIKTLPNKNRSGSGSTVAGIASQDITLIDYLNGKKLNGKLKISQKSED